MKANELRIGNLVYWNIPNKMEKKIVHEVTAIINPTLHTCPISLGRLDEDGYVGIQITEEWLLKFGFYQDIEDDRYLEFKIKNDKWNRTLTVQKGEKKFMVSNRFDEWIICGECEYVHQLQNLYFSLTGSELEIK